VIPARNEEKFIGKCIESILNGTYPKDKLEILVVDGMSEDRTREVVNKLIDKYDRNLIRLLINPKKRKTPALNMGIRSAKGEFIVIADAHSIYPRDYILKLIEYLSKYNADNVGGIAKATPRDNKKKSIAIAEVISHRFGTGGAKFRTGVDKPMEVDTVPYGCFRKSLIDKIGYFNENLVRTEDIEFNRRIKKNGGRVMIFPDIEIKYLARSSYSELFINNFSNGFGIIWESQYSGPSFSLRHLIPLLFLTTLITFGVLSIFFDLFKIILVTEVVLYIFSTVIFSLKISTKRKDLSLFPYIFWAFVTLHFSYALGSIWGIIKLTFRRMRY